MTPAPECATSTRKANAGRTQTGMQTPGRSSSRTGTAARSPLTGVVRQAIGYRRPFSSWLPAKQPVASTPSTYASARWPPRREEDALAKFGTVILLLSGLLLVVRASRVSRGAAQRGARLRLTASPVATVALGLALVVLALVTL